MGIVISAVESFEEYATTFHVKPQLVIRDACLGLGQLVLHVGILFYILTTLWRGEHLKVSPVYVSVNLRPPDQTVMGPNASDALLPCGGPSFMFESTLSASQAVRVSSYLNHRGDVVLTSEYVNDSSNGGLVDAFLTFGAQVVGIRVEDVEIASQRMVHGTVSQKAWIKSKKNTTGFDGGWGIAVGPAYWPMGEIDERREEYKMVTGQTEIAMISHPFITVKTRTGSIIPGELTPEGDEIHWNQTAVMLQQAGMFKPPWVRLPTYESVPLTTGQPFPKDVVALHDFAGSSDWSALLRDVAGSVRGHSITLLVRTVNKYPCFEAEADAYMISRTPQYMMIATAVDHKVEKRHDCLLVENSLPVQHGGTCTGKTEKSPYTDLGTSVVLLPRDEKLIVDFNIEGVPVNGLLKGELETCEPVTHVCKDTVPIAAEMRTWVGVRSQYVQLSLKDLFRRAEIQDGCQHERGCGIRLNVHITNSLLMREKVLWLQDKELGEVHFHIQVYKQGLSASMVTDGPHIHGVNGGLLVKNSYRGIGLVATTSSEVRLFTWNALFTYLGSTAAWFGVATTFVAFLMTGIPDWITGCPCVTRKGCPCVRRKAFYKAYTDLEVPDVQTIETNNDDTALDKVAKFVKKNYQALPGDVRGSPLHSPRGLE